MGFSLKQKIALAFLLSSIAVLGMMFSVTQYVFQTEFSKYITTTHKKQDREILTYLTETVNREGRLNTRVRVKSGTREITELADSINHLGASLEKQETLRRRMTSDISHELRTPLNIIQSQLEAYIDGVWQPTDERLKSTHAEVIRLSNLVKELEKLTELDESQVPLIKSRIRLNRMLKDLSIQMQPMYHEKNLIVTFTEEPEVDIIADPDKIKQVFLNLLVNAYKFTPNNGRIEILLAKDKENAVIRIRDNGIGISPEELPNIFERFYRAEPSRNRDTGGAGLGLSIVQSIVKAHNGSIHVESEKGKGTQFTVSLPLQK